MRISLDERGSATLDGIWDFVPGDFDIASVLSQEPHAIAVPGLWEAQGWLELDGPAWYRMQFEIDEDDVKGWWTLRFGAVMDVAEVYIDGNFVGRHDTPFTPFEFDITRLMHAGRHHLAVRVVDHALDSPEHVRSPHGKQGWANHVFPSRPSLYMTYGGIWQTVSLRRHGPVRIDDVFVNSDPHDLTIDVTLANMSDREQTARLGTRALGFVAESTITVAPDAVVVEKFCVGATTAARWSPEQPMLHDMLVDVVLDGRGLSDALNLRFGLRVIRVDGHRILVDDVPYRMRSALVQGFRADRLYAEGDRTAIVEEVKAARDMGFNTLRLHIKAFDPIYLDVCDELGMLLHCDVPIAEPISHADMGGDTELAHRCATAIREQVRRDRNHPSIVLWSAMNEVTLDGREWRGTRAYEEFARHLGATVAATDPSRPFIENDWVEAEPERVFAAPVLTAHWYGRLHADYLEKLERQCARTKDLGKPFYVTEFGDWGLPEMPDSADAPFWDPRAAYAKALALTRWPHSIGRFARETQRYQGLSDRLQGEILRRHDHIGGYCVTELTDVPHEMNGILDLRRTPKAVTVAEIRRLNQPVLPMLRLDSLVHTAGSPVRAALHIANDGPALADAEVRVRFDCAGPEQAILLGVGSLPAHRVTSHPGPRLVAPEVSGNHDLLIELFAAGDSVARNRYPVHVVERPHAPVSVKLLGASDMLAQALQHVGASACQAGPLVVDEASLSRAVKPQIEAELARGGTVLLLAQTPSAAEHYPMHVALEREHTQWGSSVFHFTTDTGALPTFPRQSMLVGEDATIHAHHIATRIAHEAFPDEPAVIGYKPVPGALTGTVVGRHRVGPGQVLFCQYRLIERVLGGDAAARGLLADLLNWAVRPRPLLQRRDVVHPKGRRVRLYSWTSEDG
jgi:hypothetical protein